MTESLPEELERFLRANVESVETITVLLLMFAQPARRWTCEEVGREARTNERSAERQLRMLSERGVVQAMGGQPPRFRAQESFGGVIALLASTFLARRVAVTRFIYDRTKQA